MDKFKMVVSGLERCIKSDEGGKCDGCLYHIGFCPNCDAYQLKHDALKLLKAYDEALRLMVYQYCTIPAKTMDVEGYPEDTEVFHNRYMCAGEHAFRVLGIENNEIIPEDFA